MPADFFSILLEVSKGFGNLALVYTYSMPIQDVLTQST